MKKFIYTLWAAALALVACNTAEPSAPIEKELGIEDIVLNINVGGFGPETKAVKTGWTEGDMIHIWYSELFDDQYVPDITIIFKDNIWQVQEFYTANTPQESGHLVAFYESGDNYYSDFDVTFMEDCLQYTSKVYQGSSPYPSLPLVVYTDGIGYTYDKGVLTATLNGWKFLNNVQLVVSGLDSEEDYYMEIDGGGYVNNVFGISRGSSPGSFVVSLSSYYTSGVTNAIHKVPGEETVYDVAFYMTASQGNIGTAILHDLDGHAWTFDMPELTTDGFYAAKVDFSKFEVAPDVLTTCAQVLSGDDGRVYRVGGFCTRIVNTNYGNWYIDDGTDELYIFGTVNDKGNYAWSDFGIDVGDWVMVEGEKSTYQSTTVELKAARFIYAGNPPIAVTGVSPSYLKPEGGDISLSLTSYGGSNISVQIAPSARSWLSVKSVTDTQVILTAAAGGHVDRTADVYLKGTFMDTQFTLGTSILQMVDHGTVADDPLTVAEAIALCNLSSIPDRTFYIKGIVSSVGEFNASYGNCTFWLSEDGTYADNPSKDFEVYRAKWLNNQKWTNSDPMVEEGDEVIICGKLAKYGKTCETSQNNAYVYSVTRPE